MFNGMVINIVYGNVVDVYNNRDHTCSHTKCEA